MNVVANKTPRGIKSYPMHTHGEYEIMHYLEGEGNMRLRGGSIPFKAGTIIIMPPGVKHGSSSDGGFINISILCDFGKLFNLGKPAVIYDICAEGDILAKMIYENRYSRQEYLGALCMAYAHLILGSYRGEGVVNSTLKQLMQSISDNAFDNRFSVTDILKKSGFSEDYIRALFKKKTGKTPIEFLTDIRIKRACYLIDIYKGTVSLSEIAEMCGYLDYAYFSKKFKDTVGVSPRAYGKKQG